MGCRCLHRTDSQCSIGSSRASILAAEYSKGKKNKFWVAAKCRIPKQFKVFAPQVLGTILILLLKQPGRVGFGCDMGVTEQHAQGTHLCYLRMCGRMGRMPIPGAAINGWSRVVVAPVMPYNHDSRARVLPSPEPKVLPNPALGRGSRLADMAESKASA